MVGLGRKYRIFNADINVRLRYMAERGLTFFHLDSPLDTDPAITSVKIDGRTSLGVPFRISVDGSPYTDITAKLLEDLWDRISDSIVVVYSNTDMFFGKILQRMEALGFRSSSSISGGHEVQSYGRVYRSNPRVWIPGKICIESSSFVYAETGLEGLMETSRTSGLPIVDVSKVTTGTAVSSMEEYIAVGNGVLIPLYKDDHEAQKSASTLLRTDMGGMVFQPDPGIYTDVYEIDFSSMYPSIIVRYNLSPETLGGCGDFHVPGTPYYVDMKRRGFLSMALDQLLKRRLYYKSIKGLSETYERRDAALKWMLLTSFGYTGYKNAKFGRIEVHESVTAIGRDLLVRSANIARKHGFQVIHGIVDSLWIRGNGDVDKVIKEIGEDTGIGIVLDGHYRWIAFLPARSGLGALNRYFGLRYDGSFKVRGIDIRRRDAPPIVKRFQMDLLEALRGCRNPDDIKAKFTDLLSIRSEYMRRIGSYPREMYEIAMPVNMHKEDFRVNSLHRAAIEIAHRGGYFPEIGERIRAVVVSKDAMALDLWDSSSGTVDSEFYRSLIDRAFEPFMFLAKSSGWVPAQTVPLF
ncbi:type B DNA-directed DNA polymerase [Thermoplasmatales archaeon AK]|nr:type B DNA-directed DNA polymerase [Thermoplasmatales archaeon AK]